MEKKPDVLMVGEEKPILMVADRGRDVVSTLKSVAREEREKLITGIKDMQNNQNRNVTLPHNFMGFFKKSKKTSTPSYSRMMENRINKRRMRNRMAAKSRRINRLRLK